MRSTPANPPRRCRGTLRFESRADSATLSAEVVIKDAPGKDRVYRFRHMATPGGEAAWIKAVAGFLPEAVPSLLAEDAAAGMFAMDYLSPQSFEVCIWHRRAESGTSFSAKFTDAPLAEGEI